MQGRECGPGDREFESRLLASDSAALPSICKTAGCSRTPIGDGYFVIASKGGAPQHPGWYRNILAREILAATSRRISRRTPPLDQVLRPWDSHGSLQPLNR